jgi:hypothetical protein
MELQMVILGSLLVEEFLEIMSLIAFMLLLNLWLLLLLMLLSLVEP